jgi:hypothetical protein
MTIIRNKIFPFSAEQQKLLFKAGFTIVFCDTLTRKVTFCDGQKISCIQQQTRDATRQRASVYLAPNFIVFLDDELQDASYDQLNRSGFICRQDLVRTMKMGTKVYILEQKVLTI